VISFATDEATASAMSSSDLIATASLIIALAALAVALYAIFKGNRNSSVASMVTLNEAFRQAWPRFLNATSEEEKRYELAELVNLFEIACGIQNENTFTGISNRLLKAYLEEVLKLLVGSQYASEQITTLMSQPDTFQNIRKFLNSEQAQALSITIPKKWYQK
jgi:hypothetical protein